jgi:hypothetical protein
MEQFRAIEVRIGGLRKSVLEPGYYFNYYDPDLGEADLMFGFLELVYLRILPLFLPRRTLTGFADEYDQAEIFDVFSGLLFKKQTLLVNIKQDALEENCYRIAC